MSTLLENQNNGFFVQWISRCWRAASNCRCSTSHRLLKPITAGDLLSMLKHDQPDTSIEIEGQLYLVLHQGGIYEIEEEMNKLLSMLTRKATNQVPLGQPEHLTVAAAAPAAQLSR